MLNGFDYAILGVFFLSALIGVVRGFVRETLSLISWILAFWIAFTYASSIASYFDNYINAPALRVAVSFALLFLCALIVLTVASLSVYRLLTVSRVSGMDRTLGGVFGVARAVAIVAGFMLVAGVTPLPQENWWRDSLLAKHFQPLIVGLRELLPTAVAEQLRTK